MKEVQANTSRRVALLFTRYPVATETFLEREVRALSERGLAFDIFALWPASKKIPCAVQPKRVMQALHLVLLLVWIPYWLVRQPMAMARIATALIEARRPNFLNFWESMLGAGFAIIHAHRLQQRYTHLHAVWSSAPATAAWAVWILTGIPYSMAGHAYDLFEDGGDGLLPFKIPSARFMRTSTEAGRKRWIELGAPADKVHVIRRGLTEFPPVEDKTACNQPLRILGVGRLVEKMGFQWVLRVLRELDSRDCPFEAIIVGGGPLRDELESLARILGISGCVFFAGPKTYKEVEQYYRWADMLVFGGQTAKSGDRAGFPNVIGEAMAWGVPVCATDVGAVTEGVRDGLTGLVFADPSEAAQKIIALSQSPQAYAAMRAAARRWIEKEFDSMQNMQQLKGLLESCRA